ncbi:hypothetical protein [Luteimonas huabeiensis]|uniref:hypothetical protein n=1 Tax=Luteimonas huabeiensis TaxID=1244513 RepID=UPI001F2704DB|nr:hypothetical protein [Luteimonas huabeiensis]
MLASIVSGLTQAAALGGRHAAPLGRNLLRRPAFEDQAIVDVLVERAVPGQ